MNRETILKILRRVQFDENPVRHAAIPNPSRQVPMRIQIVKESRPPQTQQLIPLWKELNVSKQEAVVAYQSLSDSPELYDDYFKSLQEAVKIQHNFVANERIFTGCVKKLINALTDTKPCDQVQLTMWVHEFRQLLLQLVQYTQQASTISKRVVHLPGYEPKRHSAFTELYKKNPFCRLTVEQLLVKTGFCGTQTARQIIPRWYAIGGSIGISELDLNLMLALGMDYEPHVDVSRLMSAKHSEFVAREAGDQADPEHLRDAFEFIRTDHIVSLQEIQKNKFKQVFKVPFFGTEKVVQLVTVPGYFAVPVRAPRQDMLDSFRREMLDSDISLSELKTKPRRKQKHDQEPEQIDPAVSWLQNSRPKVKSLVQIIRQHTVKSAEAKSKKVERQLERKIMDLRKLTQQNQKKAILDVVEINGEDFDEFDLVGEEDRLDINDLCAPQPEFSSTTSEFEDDEPDVDLRKTNGQPLDCNAAQRNSAGADDEFDEESPERRPKADDINLVVTQLQSKVGGLFASQPAEQQIQSIETIKEDNEEVSDDFDERPVNAAGRRVAENSFSPVRAYNDIKNVMNNVLQNTAVAAEECPEVVECQAQIVNSSNQEYQSQDKNVEDEAVKIEKELEQDEPEHKESFGIQSQDDSDENECEKDQNSTTAMQNLVSGLNQNLVEPIPDSAVPEAMNQLCSDINDALRSTDVKVDLKEIESSLNKDESTFRYQPMHDEEYIEPQQPEPIMKQSQKLQKHQPISDFNIDESGYMKLDDAKGAETNIIFQNPEQVQIEDITKPIIKSVKNTPDVAFCDPTNEKQSDHGLRQTITDAAQNSQAPLVEQLLLNVMAEVQQVDQDHETSPIEQHSGSVNALMATGKSLDMFSSENPKADVMENVIDANVMEQEQNQEEVKDEKDEFDEVPSEKSDEIPSEKSDGQKIMQKTEEDESQTDEFDSAHISTKVQPNKISAAQPVPQPMMDINMDYEQNEIHEDFREIRICQNVVEAANNSEINISNQSGVMQFFDEEQEYADAVDVKEVMEERINEKLKQAGIDGVADLDHSSWDDAMGAVEEYEEEADEFDEDDEDADGDDEDQDARPVARVGRR